MSDLRWAIGGGSTSPTQLRSNWRNSTVSGAKNVVDREGCGPRPEKEARWLQVLEWRSRAPRSRARLRVQWLEHVSWSPAGDSHRSDEPPCCLADFPARPRISVARLRPAGGASSRLPCAARAPAPTRLRDDRGRLALHHGVLEDRTSDHAARRRAGRRGLGLTLPWRPKDGRWLGGRSRGGVYAAFGAPVFLSGSATFAGYIKLDDTATWLASPTACSTTGVIRPASRPPRTR